MKKGKTKYDLALQIRDDIRNFKKKNKLDRAGDGLVRVDGSVHESRSAVHETPSFEKAMKENHPAIAPSHALCLGRASAKAFPTPTARPT